MYSIPFAGYVALFICVPERAFALQLRDEKPKMEESPNRLKLHRMVEKGLQYDGAVCLDGSDAGFYYAPAIGDKHKHDWQIVFEGGGWCYRVDECAERALDGHYGSSNSWEEYYVRRDVQGVMSDDCNVNPEFCNFNRVLVPYCDGTSFAGNREDPVQASKPSGMPTLVYFRGGRIVDALFDTLLDMGLAKANSVMLSGWSAGALAAVLHADRIQERLKRSAPNLDKFRVVPMSGFFLDHMSKKTDSGDVFAVNSKVYNKELGSLAIFANTTGYLDEDCVNDLNASACLLAPNAYKYVKAPTFIVNSGIDEWQVYFLEAMGFPRKLAELGVPGNGFEKAGSDFTHEMKDWQTCFASEALSKCSTRQIKKLVLFQKDFEHELLDKAASQVGNGIFLHSCPFHGEAFDNLPWSSIKIDGMTEQEAVHAWWKSDATDSSSTHSHWDCHLNAEGPPYACNPSCPTFVASLG